MDTIRATGPLEDRPGEAGDDRRLDGNAAAGLLGEVFRSDVTVTPATCGGCSATHQIGALILYAHGMGMILRCPACGSPLIRVARRGGRLHLDLRGLSRLDVESGPIAGGDERA